MKLCSVEGCRNAAQPDRRGMCWGHYRRARLRLPIDVELQEPKGKHGRLEPFDRLLEAALVLLEVRPTDKRGWRKARHRLAVAADRYVEAKKRRRSPRPRQA